MTERELRVFVEAVDVRGPGLPDWDAARPVLAGRKPYHAAPISFEPPPHLSPAERRRAIPSVRLAMAVAAAAISRSARDPAMMPAVFASSGADGDTIAAVLSALASPEREVSPTRFHNSVHNAPSGYWGVAMRSREAVTSLSGHDASFAAGLLEAAVQAVTMRRPVLLVAYDLPYPHPLDSVRPIGSSFGAAMVLSGSPSDHAWAGLTLRLLMDGRGAVSRCDDPRLENLRRGNPAARSLPLLCALASGALRSVRLEFGPSDLEIGTMSC